MPEPSVDLRGTLNMSGAPPLGSLEWFLFLALLGFWLFPLRPDSKLPAVPGWQQVATRDPDRIAAFLRDDIMGLAHGRNVGALAYKFRDGHAAVVDIDVRDGKAGAATFAQMQQDGLIERPLMTTRTASNGSHLWYRVTQPLRSGANLLGPGVDLKSAGGYVVAPGSSIGERYYTVEGLS